MAESSGDFKMNPHFEEDLFLQAALASIVKAEGESRLATAKSTAGAHADTGEFARSMKGKFSRGRRNRPHFYIYSDDPAALSKEFGTSDTPAVRALGSAL